MNEGTCVKIQDITIIIAPEESFDQVFSAIPPLGVGIISNYLSHRGYGHTIKDLYREFWHDPEIMKAVRLLNNKPRLERYINGNNDREIDGAIKSFVKTLNIRDNAVYAFSLNFKPTDSMFATVLGMAYYLKSKCHCINVLGGFMFPEYLLELMKYDFIDFAVSSIDLYTFNGHYAFAELCDQLNKSQPDYSRVPGLIYREESELRQNAPVDIDGFFPPGFQKFDLDLYRTVIPQKFSISKESVLALPYRFAAGCKNKCAFCTNARFNEKHHSSSSEIVHELSHIVEQTGCRNFMFLNSCFNIDRRFTTELARGMSEDLDIRWSDCATFEHLDTATVELLAKSGCIRLIFGLESLSGNSDRFIKKKLDLSHITDIMLACRDNNIWLGVDIITGFPHETLDEVKAFADVLESLSDHIDSASINRFMLQLRIPMYQRAAEYGIKPHKFTGNTIGQPFDEVKGRSWDEIRKNGNQAYRILEELFKRVHGYCNDQEMLPILFWLHEKYADKQLMRSAYADLVKEYKHVSGHKRYQYLGEVVGQINMDDVCDCEEPEVDDC